MKQIYLLLLLLTFSTQLKAETSPINVADLNFRIAPMSTHQMAYGFAEGDKIIINYSEERGKKLKNFEIIEYKASKVYSDFNVITINQKEVVIKRTGIYIFKFENTSLARRICNFKIDRIPVSEDLISFNTTVKERTLTDTTYTIRQEEYVKSESYKVKEVTKNQHFYVNSGSNAMFKGGKSRVTLPFVLPQNTVKWYYTVSSFRDNDLIESTNEQINLVSDLSSLVDSTGSLGFAIDQLATPPGADYCDVYLLDHSNNSLFLNKDAFKHYPIGTRENIIAANVEITSEFTQQMYLGIKNPDSMHGINVLVSIAAIVKEQEIGIKEIKEPHITSTKELYLEN
ncbi:hypothetical protein KO504_04985 [Winogradskyella psychrotolerans]|uniref:hypothetical protein n=1 Tax=Winogradskyella psychrotolerans TaxID=1344585 RepID=UPI001C0661DE|nr:hypothetical protein [Winogradskyella psychrotolerans]MBU2920684.1 hypothetical protein [Winogradskyella psychrotolerans]